MAISRSGKTTSALVHFDIEIFLQLIQQVRTFHGIVLIFLLVLTKKHLELIVIFINGDKEKWYFPFCFENSLVHPNHSI